MTNTVKDENGFIIQDGGQGQQKETHGVTPN